LDLWNQELCFVFSRSTCCHETRKLEDEERKTKKEKEEKKRSG